MDSRSDSEIIGSVLLGETDSYRSLVDRYKVALYRHCFAILRNEAEAEDIAQETFIAAYYNLSKYKKRYAFGTWIFKIATNKCLNHLKKMSKEMSADDKLIASIASKSPGPVEKSNETELRQAVLGLKPKYQAVISLYYWQGLSYEDTALVMGAPINSVRVWLKRAKDDLRKELS